MNTGYDADGYKSVVAHTHTPGEAVKENEITATCTADGRMSNLTEDTN